VHVDLLYDGISRRFPAEIETVAYRIIQESLTNVARYAGVHTATVRLFADETYLMLRVDDAGQGFDYSMVVEAQTTGGLSGMSERVRLIGGGLHDRVSAGARHADHRRVALDGLCTTTLRQLLLI